MTRHFRLSAFIFLNKLQKKKKNMTLPFTQSILDLPNILKNQSPLVQKNSIIFNSAFVVYLWIFFYILSSFFDEWIVYFIFYTFCQWKSILIFCHYALKAITCFLSIYLCRMYVLCHSNSSKKCFYKVKWCIKMLLLFHM